MRNLLVVILWLSSLTGLIGQPGTEYYLPAGSRYNPAIPTPESVIGFKTGEYHLTYDKLIRYLEILDQASDRISIVKIGETYEKQPLIQLIISSPANQQNLDKLRRDHLAALDPGTQTGTRGKDPLVVWLGYSIHGNEPSGANAVPVVAYYLAACENENIVQMLDQTVVLLDPCLNPDGLNRFASFINTRKSLNNNSDPNSFEFQEPWPGGRSNHYWFDLNRDWLLLQHPETRALVAQFHYWKPNVVTDHHEMGSNSTFFFQPGVPARSNPLVPPGNFALTQKIGTYHAKALDQIGSLYFTEETFDDFYFGKGSSYPDIHGSIGILFEQASSRGHLRQTINGPLTFPFTIRNQVTVSLSTLNAAHDLKKELQFYMADFIKTAMTEGENSLVKGYIFGDSHESGKSRMMLDILLQHQIRVANLDKPVEVNGIVFDPSSSWFIPTNQIQYRLIRSLFEPVTKFSDSTFYDVSAWTLPLATGIKYEAVDSKTMAKFSGNKIIQKIPDITGQIVGTENQVGYLIPCDPYLVHKSLFQILNQGIHVKIATAPFLMDFGQKRVDFQPGTLLVPVQNQPISGSDLYYVLTKLVNTDGLTMYSAPTGYSPDGPDLGSGKFSDLILPKVLTFSGAGNSGITGEIWHLLDSRFIVPLTIADINKYSSINLDSYTTIILTGSYDLDAPDLDKLRDWVRKGGSLIGIESGCSFLAKNGFAKLTSVEKTGEEKTGLPELRPYSNRTEDMAGKTIPGTIFLCNLDTTHPLAYGYHSEKLAIFKEGNSLYKPSQDVYENLAVFSENPLLSGYVNKTSLALIKGSSAVQRQSMGSGKVILFFDDPLFRGYWAATHKLFLNALFWGKI
jgi:hypothetical protein